MKLRVRFLPLLFVCLAAFVFAGCVNVAGGGMGLSLVTFLVLALGMGVVACSDDATTSGDTGWQVDDDIASEDTNSAGDTSQPADTNEPQDAAAADAQADAEEGTWESCCNDGVVDSCFCPAMMACNYGMYQSCGNGTCTYGGQPCPEIDAGVDIREEDIREDIDNGNDADIAEPGTWEPCCNDGIVDSCFCPADMACNYGMYHDCGEGTCVFGGGTCPDDDGEGI